MYSVYSSATLVRAKGSFSYTYPSSLNERCRHCCGGECTPSAELTIYALPVHPRFLSGYCLRQSALIHWSPSRSLLYGGAAAALYDRRRCQGSYREVIGLLADIEGSYRETTGVGCASGRLELGHSGWSSKSKVETGKVCSHRRPSRREDVSCRAVKYSSKPSYFFASSSSFSDGSVAERDRCRRVVGECSRAYGHHGVDSTDREVRKEEDCARSARRHVLARNADWERNSGERGRHRRVLGECSRGYGYHGVDSTEREVQEVRKEEDGARLARRHVLARNVDWERNSGEGFESQKSEGMVKVLRRWEVDDREGRDASLMDQARETKERYIWEVGDIVGERDSKDALQKQMVVSEAYDSNTRRTSSWKNWESGSSSSVKQQSQVDQTTVESNESRRSSEKLKEISGSHTTDMERVSGAQRYVEKTSLEDRVDTSTSVKNSVQFARDRRNQMERLEVDKTELSQHYENLTDASRIRASDSEKHSSVQSIFQTRSDDREYHSSAVKNSVQFARDTRNQMERLEVNKIESSQHYENLTDASWIRASDSEEHSSMQSVVGTRSDDQEHHSTSAVNLVHQTREQQDKIKEHIDWQHRSRSERDNRLSELSRSETERISSLQVMSNTKIGQDHSTSAMNLVHGTREQQNQSSKSTDHRYSTTRTSERNATVSESSSSEVALVSSSQGISITRTDNREDNSSLMLVRDKKDQQKGVQVREDLLSEKTQMAITGKWDGGSSSVYTYMGELDNQTSREGPYSLKGGRLDSASRLDKSSTLYVGEFVDKIREEILITDKLDNTSIHSSEIQMEEMQRGTNQTTYAIDLGAVDATTSNTDDKYVQESAWQFSSRSGMKGSSDAIWDVRGPYSLESSRVEPEEDSSPPGAANDTAAPSSTENSIIRRSPRSLWTYISDIIRLGWRSRAESQDLTSKSGKRSSSNESVSSEAWFSGHEPDEYADDESDNKRRDDTANESRQMKRPTDPSHLRMRSAPSQQSSEASGPGNRVTLSETSSTSKGSIKRDPLSRDASHMSSPVSKQEVVQWDEGENEREGIPSGEVTIEQPSALIVGRVSPTLEEETIMIGPTQTPGSGLLKLKEEEELNKEKLHEAGGTESRDGELNQRKLQRNKQVLKGSFDEWGEAYQRESEQRKIEEEELNKEKLHEAGGTETKDGELNQRKLQRNKQVLKGSFDEWEEAYQRESEQRKIDEFFMREALLEAKKAADTWEVPVGAVLVQKGKIIARGCNLVEELRDSTAHAEMICIREASSFLRTWRLAETTLYVTLEPCPMCAGAILQARVDAVVWGAPNKLLGADGSWVRLFPGGNGGNSSLDPSNQTVGPVHPFHPKVEIRRGILATECADVMQQFFQLRRRKKKKTESPPPSCLPISTHPTKLFGKMHDLFCMMFCL